MASLPWEEKEFKDLLKTLHTCASTHDAARKHNAKWSTGRSSDAIVHLMERRGLRCGDFLERRQAKDTRGSGL